MLKEQAVEVELRFRLTWSISSVFSSDWTVFFGPEPACSLFWSPSRLSKMEPAFVMMGNLADPDAGEHQSESRPTEVWPLFTFWHRDTVEPADLFVFSAFCTPCPSVAVFQFPCSKIIHSLWIEFHRHNKSNHKWSLVIILSARVFWI